MQSHEEARDADRGAIQCLSNILDGLSATRLRTSNGARATSGGPERIPTRNHIVSTARLQHPQVMDDDIPQHVRFLGGLKRAFAGFSELATQVRPAQPHQAFIHESVSTEEP